VTLVRLLLNREDGAKHAVVFDFRLHLLRLTLKSTVKCMRPSMGSLAANVGGVLD
jgi:hypothetical protein